MRIRVQAIIESDQETAPLRSEEVACFERGTLTEESLGLRLSEAKQLPRFRAKRPGCDVFV